MASAAAAAASSSARWPPWLLCYALLLRLHASSCESLPIQQTPELSVADTGFSRPRPASWLHDGDDLVQKHGADGDGRYRPELPFYLSAHLKPLSQLYPSVLKQPSEDEMDINEEHASIKALYQGDIVLPAHLGFLDDGQGLDASDSLREQKRPRRASTSVQEQLWPNAIVPYTIHSSIQQDEERMFSVQAAIYNWERKTCLRFVPRRSEPDYVEFKHEEGCWSYIGRRGGRQVLSVGDRCAQIGIMIHEIGHALGLWHEHSRPDRDAHIRIRWDNIAPARLKNFAKSSARRINSLGTPYDVSSIMHYGPRSFGMRDQTGRKRTTIELVNSGQERGSEMGQRIALSDVDVEQMNLLYRCAAKGENGLATTATTTTAPPLPCMHGGTRSKEGGCLCPEAFGGDSCEIVRAPASCEELRTIFDESEDGFYNITVRSCARPLEVYCKDMNGSGAATFIVPARSSHTYSHFYGPRTVGGLVETGGGGGSCQGKLRRDEWKQKGVTLFFRLRLDTARMTLVQDDYSFSFSFGKRRPLGWAGDCYSRAAHCRRGTLRINLLGSGVRFAGLPAWHLRGGDVGHSIRLHSSWLVAGSCGGWCGQCRLHDVRVTPEHC